MIRIDGVVETVVIGAGPVGCVAALAFAQRGARVLLLEAHPHASSRLAGEWLHPAGVRVLERLGIDLTGAPSYPTGRGFVIVPDDGAPPIALEYPDRSVGYSCDHGALVSALRSAVIAHPKVTFTPFARATRFDRNRVTFERKGHSGTTTVAVDLVVGADGRSSATRKALGLRDDRVPVSSTAGLLLTDAELPFEGFGHLLLSGPGPAFIYRIGPNQIRACLDMPPSKGVDPPRGSRTHAQDLWDAYSAVLPQALLPAFRRALESWPIAWAANYFRPRSS